MGLRGARDMLDERWQRTLCEYMMTNQNQTQYVRRQVRKLLLFACGNKEKYRQLRDSHALDSHIKSVRSALEGRQKTTLSYDDLLSLIEHLRACSEVAAARSANWQRFCRDHRPSVVLDLFKASLTLDDGVTPVILQLLQYATCELTSPSRDEPAVNDAFPLHLFFCDGLLTRFVERHLLQCNATAVRWQVGSLI